jgi:hypothetical protein
MAEETIQQSGQEEYFENQATGFEVEDIGDTTELTGPWDPAKIRISPKTFSVREVVQMMRDGDIDLAPDFQRYFVWKPKQRSLLIESILLGIPLPTFYFNQSIEGVLQVVDGVQRLTTILRFSDGDETLGELRYLSQFKGKNFAELDQTLQRRFNQTQIFVNIIEPQTPDDVKFDVFRRLNTGGSPLTAQEIRHCLSRTRSREFLKKLTSLASFTKATGSKFAKELRMTDRELALRFCAFRSISPLENYRTFESFDSFLLDFTRRLDGAQTNNHRLSDVEIDRLGTDFDRAMTNAELVFGEKAFRKFVFRLGPINRALFESWAVALADYEASQLLPHKDGIVEDVAKHMTEYEHRAYLTAISQSTGNFAQIKKRFEVAREILHRHALPKAVG